MESTQLNFPECYKNFPSFSFPFTAPVLRLGLIHLKVEVQSAVHPCVGKQSSTALSCGRLHNFGGLKPQNNQRLISTVAHYNKTGQDKTTEQYVGDKPKHGTLLHPIYHSEEQHPAVCARPFLLHEYSCIKYDFWQPLDYAIILFCVLSLHLQWPRC